jgi:ATP-dependent Clp protease ATP-binding subunit ClpC
MFERFTDRARRVVVLAQEEARMLDHNYVGPEHVLLGLIHEGQGVAARALTELGLGLDDVRRQVEELIGQGEQAPSGHIPFTPRTKRVLELSLREALQLGHNYIGTEHILLGILREGENVAAQVLVRMGTDLNRVRLEVIKLLGPLAEVGAVGLGESGTAARQVRTARSAVSLDFLLTELRGSLATITDRLTAIERHLGMPERAEDTGVSADDEAAERLAGQLDGPPGGEPGEAPGAGPDDKPEDPPGDVSATGE